MVQVLLSFDAADYTSPASDHSIKRLADILRQEDVRGSFNVVAELACAWIERGRQDIIAALKGHEINYHSHKHAWHPTIAEYTDTRRWEDGYRHFMEEEPPGIGMVKEIFGVHELYTAVSPGSSVSAQAIHGYAELNIPIVTGSVFTGTSGRGIWFCNALNFEIGDSLEAILLNEGLAGVRERLDEWKRRERLILCISPHMINHVESWDEANFKGGNRVEWGNWIIPDRRSDKAIEQFFADFQAMLRLLKQSEAFEFVTYGDIWDRRRNQTNRDLPRQLLQRLLGRVRSDFFYQETEQASYSLADLFQASVHYLCGYRRTYRTEKLIGPLYEPVGVTEQTALTAEQVKAAAYRLRGETVIPHAIQIGETRIGPRDFLEAARQILDGARVASIEPSPQLPNIRQYYGLNDVALSGTWLFPETFRDEWGSRRLKWQSWTIRSDRT